MRNLLTDFINRITLERGLLFTQFLLKKVLDVPLKHESNEETISYFIDVILKRFNNLSPIFGRFTWSKASQDYWITYNREVSTEVFIGIDREWRRACNIHYNPKLNRGITSRTNINFPKTYKVSPPKLHYYDESEKPMTPDFIKKALGDYLIEAKRNSLSKDMLKKYPLQKK